MSLSDNLIGREGATDWLSSIMIVCQQLDGLDVGVLFSETSYHSSRSDRDTKHEQ